MKTTKLNIYDYIILLIVFILPYSEGSLWFWLYSLPFIGNAGPAFMTLVLSICVFCHSNSTILRNNYKTVACLVWFATLYSLLKLVQTISATGFTESMTIYRKNYVYLLSFALIMNYISVMSHDRIRKIFMIAVKLCIPMTMVYFIQCMGVPVFASNLLEESAGGIHVMRNILGFPPVVPVIFTASFLYMIFTYERKVTFFNVMLLIACFISYTRNIMITAVLIMGIATVLYSIKYGVSQNFRLIIYSIILFISLLVFAPNSLSFWSNLIDSTLTVQLEKGVGTYAVRQKLIEYALTTIQDNDVWYTGLGYIRDVTKGQYSLVLGSDTFLAPILWCEGMVGLILRCLPIFWLLFKSFSIFRQSCKEETIFLSLVIVVSIISQIPNYVQTTIFMNYCYVFAQLFMIYVYLNQNEEYA